jgi:hypothetical protein
MEKTSNDRRTEWFVPKFGPAGLRSAIGLLFLPYTGMVLSFALIGSMVTKQIHWDRVLAIELIYFLGLGIAAHALDALGSRGGKPWGNIFTSGQLWLVAAVALISAYALAVYYMIFFVPYLWPIAVAEGFFVFSYNLEWFGGKFHTDRWFAVSWGFLPVLAGQVMQTNSLSPAALFLALSTALFSLVEIKTSRPYKALRRRESLGDEEQSLMLRYEVILKSISLGSIFLGIGIVIWRLVY